MFLKICRGESPQVVYGNYLLAGFAGWICWLDLLAGFAGWICWLDLLAGFAGWICWLGLLGVWIRQRICANRGVRFRFGILQNPRILGGFAVWSAA
jgi:hypothetical protein